MRVEMIWLAGYASGILVGIIMGIALTNGRSRTHAD
jgi:hypothetical protein